ncbi:MAG TPA: hypothetical protein DD490_07230 [Acidobacteria bacterium]|nr:hypothetical protein [Acidobacteriota bacterium]
MNRKPIIVAGALLIAFLAGQAAEAKRWGCWIQADRNVKIRNTANNATAAVNDWNSLTILNLTSVGSGEETYVFNANSGNTGWGGLASIVSYSGCTILRATAQLNTYYSWTTNAARGVHCQEIGHTFGLDHSNDGGCMGGGYWYDIATHYTIVQKNINEIGTMYASRVAGSPDFSTVGPEVDTPRFHAFWANNPRSLRETTGLASQIVVATVTGIAKGAPIVNRQPDGHVSRIPTQRVSFSVEGGIKGSLEAGDSFVLFQNGNAANRFDEDPSYAPGSRHLLFLTARGDGTYLVVSPSGRFELSDGDGHSELIPAATQGFAADLKGAKLQHVMFDVVRSLAPVDAE